MLRDPSASERVGPQRDSSLPCHGDGRAGLSARGRGRRRAAPQGRATVDAGAAVARPPDGARCCRSATSPRPGCGRSGSGSRAHYGERYGCIGARPGDRHRRRLGRLRARLPDLFRPGDASGVVTPGYPLLPQHAARDRRGARAAAGGPGGALGADPGLVESAGPLDDLVVAGPSNPTGASSAGRHSVPAAWSDGRRPPRLGRDLPRLDVRCAGGIAPA